MLNFSSLRQQVSDRFLWVVPVGIAVALHLLWLVIGARSDRDVPMRKDSGQATGMGTVVDNTAQLVRLTRRAVQQQTLPSVGLDLSGTLPPPPPELIEDVVLPDPPDARADCPPEAKTSPPSGKRRTPQPAVTSKADSNPLSLASPTESASNTGSMPGDAADSSETEQGTVGMDEATMNRLWRAAMGVPIWPDVLGPKQTNVELRELSLSAFKGRSVQDLHQSEFTTSLGRLRLWVDGQRVFLIMELPNP